MMGEPEYAMLSAINAARVERGLHALRHDARLSNAAYGHAVDLSRHPGMLHEGSDGSTILERILRAGYNASWHYEVVGWGFNGDIPPMVQWWIDSPAHAAILYDSNVTDIGVGYVYAPGTQWSHFWVVDMAAGDSEAARPFDVYVPGMWG